MCSPDYGTFVQRVNTFRDEVKSFLEHFKHVILLPLSWWLTVSHFILSPTWTLMVSTPIFAPTVYLINGIVSDSTAQNLHRILRTSSQKEVPLAAFHLGNNGCAVPTGHQDTNPHQYHCGSIQGRGSNR